MNVKVSIIVPVYNAEKQLERCLSSILTQSYLNLEVILVDDGSVDRSAAICDAARDIDARVQVIHKQNGGVSEARNIGLDLATGDYVQFVDSDDYLEQDATRCLLEVGVQHDTDVVVGGFKLQDSRTGAGRTVAFDQVVEHLDKPGFLRLYPELHAGALVQCVWNSLYRLETVRANRLTFNTALDYGEDTHFNLSFFKNAQTFSVCSCAGYTHCIGERREERLSTRTGGDTHVRRQQLHAEMMAMYGDNPSFTTEIFILERRYAQRLLTTLPYRLAVEHGFRDLRAFKSHLKRIRSDSVLNDYSDVSIDGPEWRKLIAFLVRREWDLSLWMIVKLMSRAGSGARALQSLRRRLRPQTLTPQVTVDFRSSGGTH